MVAITKVRAKDAFELMYFVRKREKDGWKRGKIEKVVHRYKHYTPTRFGHRYAGDDIDVEWVCQMTKEAKHAGQDRNVQQVQ